jgi:hypothetical protein
LRTKRCANTPKSDELSKKGSTPMSVKRVTALAASKLTGTALPANVVTSSLTAIGTLVGGVLKPVAAHHRLTVEELLAKLGL